MQEEVPANALRILVAGAGALGSVFGGLLRQRGHAVTLLGRVAHLEAIAARGLCIDGLWGAHLIHDLALATSPVTLQGPFDAVFVTVKSYDTDALVRAVAPHLAPGGVWLSLQNGLGNAEVLATAAGTDRVLAGRVIFGAAVIAPGHVRVTVYAEPVLIGAWPAAAAASASRAAQLGTQARAWARRCTDAGIPSLHCDDIRAALWGKVLYNAALNPLGALLGVHYGALGEDADTRAVMDAVIDEAFEVARSEGIALPWATAADYRAAFYGRLIPATYHHRSSMLQDLERGRRTEIDAINGALWRLGTAHGIVTAVNELLTRLLHARERMARGSRQ